MIGSKFNKGFKKYLGLVAVLALLIVACPMPVAALNGTVVSIPDASAANCNTVIVPINITDVTNL